MRRCLSDPIAPAAGCSAVLAVAILTASDPVAARPFRVDQVPNGPVSACFTCHLYPGGPRNAFGTTVETYGGVGFLVGGNVQWGTLAIADPARPNDPPKTLAEIDSDGDGRTNGEELLDPAGIWRPGTPNPGLPSLVRLPGLLDPAVVIRQVYASGGAAGATYQQDFIELYNRSTTSTSVAGWSIQSAAAIGGAFFGSTASTLTPLPAVTLAPGQSLLVPGASGGGVGASLPFADVVDATPIALPDTGGKVALVSTTSPLPCNGTFPDLCTSPAIVDVVGYGNADYYEGLAPAPAPSSSTALARSRGGCTDKNSNGSSLAAVEPDFTLTAPTLRGSASPLVTCAQVGSPSGPAQAPASRVTHVQLLFGLLAAAGALLKYRAATCRVG